MATSKEELLQKLGSRGKNLMSKVENNDYSTGNVDPTLLEQQADPNTQAPAGAAEGADGYQPKSTQELMQSVESQDLSKLDEDVRKQKVENSNLPDNVKQMMTENPTPRADPSVVNSSETFSIEDVHKVMGGQGPSGGQGQQQAPPQQQKQVMTEQNGNSGKQMLNEDKMRNLIKDEFINLMFNDNVKQSLIKEIKEEAVKEAIKDIKNKIKRKKSNPQQSK